jgi:flavin-binding protein dodecin
MAKGGKKKGASAEQAVYKFIEIVGTSRKSWADAARNGVVTASKTLRDLRVAEVDKLDLRIEGGEIVYRVKLNVSFKYHGND